MLQNVKDFQTDLSVSILKKQYDHKVVPINAIHNYQTACSHIYELKSQVKKFKSGNEGLIKHINDFENSFGI